MSSYPFKQHLRIHLVTRAARAFKTGNPLHTVKRSRSFLEPLSNNLIYVKEIPCQESGIMYTPYFLIPFDLSRDKKQGLGKP